VSDTSESRGILTASAVMATGTVFSRASGYLRNVLLAAAIGNALHADLFNIGNTIPNMLYILLAGGIVNAVLVPQLVRAQKNDPDGGDAYTNRIITLAALFLGVVTIVLVVAAPLVMRLFLSSSYDDPSLAAQRDSAIAFARFCLPQVFFYGMYVLLGQVLNARGRFGPMMWAPIANNVISILVLVLYLVWFGPLKGLQKLLFRTPLVYFFVFGSYFYHDFAWYPTIGKRRTEQYAKTSKWMRLFEQYPEAVREEEKAA